VINDPNDSSSFFSFIPISRTIEYSGFFEIIPIVPEEHFSLKIALPGAIGSSSIFGNSWCPGSMQIRFP
jgi:hypothetical protein